MFDFERGYLYGCFSEVLRAKERSSLKYIHRVLCAVILPRLSDFERDYKSLAHFSHFETLGEALACLFEVERGIIDNALTKLADFRDIQNAFSDCICKQLR